jgi:tryptophan halogenase
VGIESIVVLGGGSAGFIAALTLKRELPQLKVTVLRSPDIGIIGVGEGTTPGVPLHLFGYLGVDIAEFYRVAQPTWKLGLKFLWGPRPYFNYTFTPQCDWKWERLSRPNGFYCAEDFEYADPLSALMTHDNVFVRQKNGDPYIGSQWGFHIENEKFVGFLESAAARAGLEVVDDTVAEVKRAKRGGISELRLKSGGRLVGDFYVDCSGFRSMLIGQAFKEPYLSYKPTLFCDRAVVGGWERGPGEPIKPYTTVETMDAGWCWQIEHESRVIRGYVHSSDFIPEDKAEKELRAKNPRIGPTRVIKFPSGRYRNAWVENACAIGNASGFVEPLEATSLAVICNESRLLAELLASCGAQPTPSVRALYNRLVGLVWDEIREFLGIHYKFNTRLNTAFWRACRSDVKLSTSLEFIEFFRENGPSTRGAFLLPRAQTESAFGIEGYLTMLVGQKVPYETSYRPSAQERDTWSKIQGEHKSVGTSGLSIRESLAAIRKPDWKWNPQFYQDALKAHVARIGL